MQYINRSLTAHAFTSTSPAYAVENTETVKVQCDVYRIFKGGNSSNKNNKNNKDISIFFVTQHQLRIGWVENEDLRPTTQKRRPSSKSLKNI